MYNFDSIIYNIDSEIQFNYLIFKYIVYRPREYRIIYEMLRLILCKPKRVLADVSSDSSDNPVEVSPTPCGS